MLDRVNMLYDTNLTMVLSQGDPDSLNVKLKSIWRESGSYTTAVDTVRNLLFLGCGPSIYIFDLTTSSVIDTLNSHDYLRDLFYDEQNTLLYVLNEYDAILDIWDMSSISSPTLLNSFFVNGIYHAMALFVRDDTAMIITTRNGLRLYDVSNPVNITFIDYVNLINNARGNDIDVSGHYAYVSTYYNGLQIIDLNNLTSHSPVGSFVPSETMFGVKVLGTYAYIVTDSGLRVVDISTPTSPTQASTLFNSDKWTNLARKGNYLYTETISTDPPTTTLRVIDISNPLNPTEVGTFTINNDYYTGDISILENSLFLPRNYGGLKWLDISDPTNPSFVTDYSIEAVTGVDLATKGDFLFVPSLLNGLTIFNLSNPSSPAFSGTLMLGLGEFANGVYLDGNKLYLLTGSKLYIIDVTHPQSPSILSTLAFPGWKRLFELYVLGNYAYLGSLDSGMVIVDISDPYNPVQVSSLPLPNGFGRRRIVVSGNYAYASFGGLHIIDVSNPANPVLVSTFDPPHLADSWDVAYYEYLGNKYVFVAFYDSLIVVDVTNPANPMPAGGWDSPLSSIIGVEIYDNKAIVANYGGDVRILDIVTPSNLSEVGYYDWPNYLWKVAVLNNKYIVGAYSSQVGFVIFEPFGGATFVNEYEPISRQSSTKVIYTKQGVKFIPSQYGILKILDVTGRTLIQQKIGKPTLIENLRPGVYFWKLTSNDVKSLESGKFIQLTP